MSHENRSYRQVLYECDCADTDRVCIDDLADGDVNNWLGYGDQVRVLIHVKFILQWRDVTSCQEETSDGKRRKRILEQAE